MQSYYFQRMKNDFEEIREIASRVETADVFGGTAVIVRYKGVSLGFKWFESGLTEEMYEVLDTLLTIEKTPTEKLGEYLISDEDRIRSFARTVLSERLSEEENKEEDPPPA